MSRDRFVKSLLNAHLKPDMRVLDLGCGSGALSFIASEIVRKEGSVIGIDSSLEALALASEKKIALGLTNIEFRLMDLEKASFSDLGQDFDAIIARRVLMYLASPETVVLRLKEVLSDGGLMLFEESDSIALALNSAMPKHQRYQKMIWEVVQKEGGKLHMGSELLGLMRKLGMKVMHYESHNQLEYGENSELASILAMMEERLLAHGIIRRETFDLEQIKTSLKKEKENYALPFIRDVVYGIVAKK